MSLCDYIKNDGQFICPKCKRLVDAQTRGAMGQSHSFTLNELAGFMALYGDGDGCLIEGYCGVCQTLSYWKLLPVTVERCESPWETAE